MNRQINFAESALSHNFAYFVVFALCFWRLTCLCKTRLNLPFQSCDYARFWSQVLIGHHRSLCVNSIVDFHCFLILSVYDFISRLFFLLRDGICYW
jgi:hypothetical protein